MAEQNFSSQPTPVPAVPPGDEDPSLLSNPATLAPRPSERRRSWKKWIVAGCFLGIVLAALSRPAFVFLNEAWKKAADEREMARQVNKENNQIRDAAERTCLDFATLKNDNDPQADTLLGPAPVVPPEPVSAEEGDRLDAEFILRGPCRITLVQPETSGSEEVPKRPFHFVLVVNGDCYSQWLLIRTPTGSEKSRRLVRNPDIHVEVRDGKIHGLTVSIHHETPEKKGLAPPQ